jgi:hypothetical protein
MSRKPPTKFKIGEKTFDLTQEVHEDNQEWRKHLVLVSALPERMIGLVEDPGQKFVPGQSFKLYATLIYIAELSFAPVVEIDEKTQKPVMDATGRPRVLGIQGSTKLHALIPYDFIGTPTIDVGHWQYVMRIVDQDEGLKKWVYTEYLNFFDPPKIVRG